MTGVMALATASLTRDYCSDLYGFRINRPDILRIVARTTVDKLNAFPDRSPNDCYAYLFPQCDKFNADCKQKHYI
jgi:hypothetical protein